MFEHFPYTNFHELNLDWLLQKFKNMELALSKLPENIESKLQEYANSDVFNNKLKDMITAIEIEKDSAIFIGDSYTLGYRVENPENTFPAILTKMLKLKTYYNYSVGGTGFSAYGTDFKRQLENAYNDAMSGKFDLNKIKYVFISGGRNDYYRNPGYGEGIAVASVNNVITYAKTNFPDAEIVVTPMLWDWTFVPLGEQSWIYYIKEGCRRTGGVTVIDNAWTFLTGRRDLIDDDLIHPNADGHKIIAESMYSALTATGIARNETYNAIRQHLSYVRDGYLRMWTDGSKCQIYCQFGLNSNFVSGDVIAISTQENGKFIAFMGEEEYYIPIVNAVNGYNAGYIKMQPSYDNNSKKMTYTFTLLSTSPCAGVIEGNLCFNYGLAKKKASFS